VDIFLQQALESWTSGMHYGIFAALIAVFLFQVKHLVVDFFIQGRFPYMWMNKHKFLHPGGWLHAGTHAVGSFMLFAGLRPAMEGVNPWWHLAFVLCTAELLIHFLIDLAKMKIGRWRGWKCDTSPYFWDLLGVDQFLHQLTYIWMIFCWFTA